MLSITDALVKVYRNVAPDVDPILTNDDLLEILADHASVATWKPSTAYSYGQIVIPTIPMGRTYRVTLAGTSDTTEPSWLLAPQWTPPPSFFAGWAWQTAFSPYLSSPWLYGLKDGTAAFCDWQQFSGEIYDVRRATYEAWLLKASRATGKVVSKRVGPLAITYATTEHCLQQARRYAPFGFQ